MHNINLSEVKHQKKKGSKKQLIFIIVLLVVLGIFISSFFKGGSDFVFKFGLPGTGLKSTNDRVNVLLLGNGGGNHDGADLTDSIMIASYNTKTNKATFISIPRDLWVPSVKGKINSVYEIGKSQDKDLSFTEQTIGEVLGLPIHYTVRLDFNGFIKAVDQVGGIDVDVANTFEDYVYPIAGKEDDLCGWAEVEKDFSADDAKQYNVTEGKMKVLEKDGKVSTNSADPDIGQDIFSCRYEHIHFNKGLTHMDGATALKYVRSRHAYGVEGSDFARSARQQKVIEAFRSKVLSANTLVNPAKISGLISAFGSSIETDIPINDAANLYGLTKKMTSSENIVLGTDGDNPLLENPPLANYGGAWVLAPVGGNFDKIHQYIQDVLSGKVNNEASSSARPSTR